jgi:hypothetical protein
LLWEPKIWIFGFLRISLKRKNPGKFFSAQKKRFLSPIRTKLLSVIVEDELNSGIVKVPAIEPIFCCGSQKYGFFGFLPISLKRKNPVKFFSAQKKRLDKSNQRCKIHCHMWLNKGAMGV